MRLATARALPGREQPLPLLLSPDERLQAPARMLLGACEQAPIERLGLGLRFCGVRVVEAIA